MKRYRVKEVFEVTIWSEVSASNEDEAFKKLEEGIDIDDNFDCPIDEKHIKTLYETLEEI